MVHCVLNKDIEGQIKDLLRITKELTFWGDGFPGDKKSLLKTKSFCDFLSYKLISKYLHFKLTTFFLQSYY